jgi:hypothetical protein
MLQALESIPAEQRQLAAQVAKLAKQSIKMSAPVGSS